MHVKHNTVKARQFRLTAILAALITLTLSAHATAAKPDLSFLAKFGQIQGQSLSTGDVSFELGNDTGAGFAVGYEFEPNWTIEAHFLQGETPVKNARSGVNMVAEATSISAFGVYRSSKRLASPYYFGKLGYGKTDFEISASGFDDLNTDDTSVSFGAGAGYQYSRRLGFEAEYLVDSDALDYFLISIRYMLDR